MLEGCLQHLRIDEYRKHAQCFIVFDETHTAHIRGEIVNGICPACRNFAVFAEVQIEREIFDIIEPLIPVFQPLDVDCSDILVPVPAEFRNYSVKLKT
jgi:hypothetical protein